MTLDETTISIGEVRLPALVSRIIWFALMGGVLLWVFAGPITKRPLFGDEGQHLTGAQNLRLDREQWLRPVFDPQPADGPSDWDINNVSFPPTLISIYALSLGAFGSGSTAFGLPLFVAHLASAVGVFWLGRRFYGASTGLLAAALWMLMPAGFRRGTQIMAEPFLVSFGVLALALQVEAMVQRSRWCCLAAGTCLGAAFLFKLWLVGPFVLMAVGLLLSRNEGFPWRERLQFLGIMALGGLSIGATHLAAVAMVAPDQLLTWTRIYLDLIVDRMNPTDNPIVPTGPVWQYLPILYRDHWPLLLPLVVVAWDSVVVRAGHWAGAVRNLYVSAFAAFCVQSIYASKSPLYIYFLAPVIAIAAAHGVMVLISSNEQVIRRLQPWLIGATLMMGAAAVLIWVFGIKELWPHVITMNFAVLHAVAAAWLVAMACLLPRMRLAARGLSMLALPIVAGGGAAAAQVQSHSNEVSRAVAEYLADHHENRDQSSPDFVSPDWHIVGFFLWHPGRPWPMRAESVIQTDVLDPLAAGRIAFVQIDREYQLRPGALPDQATHDRVVTLLHEQAIDVTTLVERRVGRRLNTLVFVGREQTQGGVDFAEAHTLNSR